VATSYLASRSRATSARARGSACRSATASRDITRRAAGAGRTRIRGGLKKIQDFSGFSTTPFSSYAATRSSTSILSRAVELHRRNAPCHHHLEGRPARKGQSLRRRQTAPDGRILRFQEKPSPEAAISTAANTGIYLFEPDVLDFVPSGEVFRHRHPALPAARRPRTSFLWRRAPFA